MKTLIFSIVLLAISISQTDIQSDHLFHGTIAPFLVFFGALFLLLALARIFGFDKANNEKTSHHGHHG